MGDLVYAGTTSHVSGIVRTPDADPAHSPQLDAAWTSMAADIAAADPDVVVLVGPDHHETFGLENLPIFCIGAADEHGAWNEHGIPGDPVAGDEKVGMAILSSLVASGFDVSRAMEMTLDHGFLVPVQRLDLGDRRIVPFYVNCNTPPLPSLQRCRDLGAALRSAIDALPDGTKVAVLGTGGVSHWVGVPRSGEINEEWDKRFLALIENGDLDAVVSMTDDEILEEAGNGALEIRTWVVTAACAGEKGGRALAYAPMYPWVTGIGIVEMEVA
ncbi:2,3-dihydroxyphenylpropionate 1,2-dioxygenase [Georgenia yuyongxinii]|nr:2,3-dihydroxyphenylpropionate 1,2-dioxygenase [Georgenia yuyongxinii]